MQGIQVAAVKEYYEYIQGTAPAGSHLCVSWPRTTRISRVRAAADGRWQAYVPSDVVLWQGLTIAVSQAAAEALPQQVTVT